MTLEEDLQISEDEALYLKRLIRYGSNLMMKGAIEYCLNKDMTEKAIAAKSESIIREIKACGGDVILEAMRDAKDAFDIGMGGYGGMIFVSTCKLAGIRIAQRVLEG